MAYEPRVAAALSGATLNQLNYWRTHRAFIPEISAVRPVLYSFRDVVALRTFTFLREKRSLQAIRRAVKSLKDLGETEHLSSYRFELQGDKGIVLIRGDGAEGVELVESPGNLVTGIVTFNNLFQSFPLDDIEVPNLLRPREFISVKREVRGGHPVVAGTRVPYEVVAGLVNDGVKPHEVAQFYPSVTAQGARDAVDFAKYVERAARRRTPMRQAA